jgi:hypothetical protein
MEESRVAPEQSPCDPLPARAYTGVETLLHNVPYILMTVLGAGALLLSLTGTRWARVAAGGYVFYGALGALWIMVFVCPYCRFWGTASCPCGYGKVAARLRDRRPGDRFNEKFKKHIPVIVPLWFLPLAFAAPALIRGFNWALMILVAAFAVDAFVILPWFSSQHGCRDCPQRGTCPWMKGKDRS